MQTSLILFCLIVAIGAESYICHLRIKSRRNSEKEK